MLTACTTDGFFYLDLMEDLEGQKLLREANELHQIAKDFFSTSVENRFKYINDKGKSLFGFKPAGTVKSTDKAGAQDSTEFMNASIASIPSPL